MDLGEGRWESRNFLATCMMDICTWEGAGALDKGVSCMQPRAGKVFLFFSLSSSYTYSFRSFFDSSTLRNWYNPCTCVFSFHMHALIVLDMKNLHENFKYA